MAKLKAPDGFRILPVAVRQAAAERLPAGDADARGLSGPDRAGQKVETIAVGAVLIAFNWPKGTDRYRRIQKFVDTFLPEARRIPESRRVIRNGRKPIWRPCCRAGRVSRARRNGCASTTPSARASATSSTSSCGPPREGRRAPLRGARPAVPGIPAVEGAYARSKLHPRRAANLSGKPSVTVGRKCHECSGPKRR